MISERLEELRLRMSERLARDLGQAQKEVLASLARVRAEKGDEGDEDYVERQFTGETKAQRATFEKEKAEEAHLDKKALAEPPPKKKRTLALRMYGWRKRMGR